MRSRENAVIIIAILIVIIVAVALVSYKQNEEPTTAKSQLTLADYPEIFKKDVIIVIRENANSIEIEAAQRIADNLGNLTGNMPVIKTDAEITEDELAGHNLILVGGADSNEVLQKVYDITDATRVTEEYPGAGKGVLEILRNPWDPEKATLLVGGSDEWGMKAGTSKLGQTYNINETSVIAELEKVGDDYRIFLSSRQFVPSTGISPSTEANITSSSLERVHVLIQFYRTPNATERENLENAGVELVTYVHNNAWFASICSDSPAKILQFSSVRWVGEILPADKISPRIQDGKIGEWAINPDGSVNIVVKLFDDVSADDAKSILGRYSSTVEGPGMLNDWTITITSEAIWELANEDGVQWIEEVSPPKTTFNNGMEVEK